MKKTVNQIKQEQGFDKKAPMCNNCKYFTYDVAHIFTMSIVCIKRTYDVQLALLQSKVQTGVNFTNVNRNNETEI